MKKERKDHQFIKKPFYEGGISAMRAFIKKQLVYPKRAKEKRIEGTVYVRYTVDYQGKVVDAKIVSGLGYGCDEEAVRLVKLLTFKVPKNRKLRAVFHKTLQIHFRLPPTQPPKKDQNFTPNSIQYTYTSSKKTADSKPEKKGRSYDITIRF